LKIIFLFPPEFGRPKASTFRSRGVPGHLDALLAKSLGITEELCTATVEGSVRGAFPTHPVNIPCGRNPGKTHDFR
jgi:hypothetical protein